MDSAPPTISLLPQVVKAVDGKMEVIVDSGIRRGSDIVKCRALGASAVLTGRATLFGTAAGGEAGALKAIDDVHLDMESKTPMDRLVCGDVGYGKTEVAIRAAFKAVNDGKQVAIVVPTTILAEQHLLTFKERFENYPDIAILCRCQVGAGP